MILRRVIAHVKAQDWFAVAIDFVIVVLGVFIGMQVTNWNARLADQATADRHLAEIAADLGSHLDMHDRLLGSALARISAVDYVYRQAFDRALPGVINLSVENWPAPTGDPIPAEKLDNLMGSINLVRVTVGSRSGYDSLISSGHLGLIDNKDLARKIQLYYDSYDNILDTGKDVLRAFRTDGAAIYQARGVSVFDERPAAEIVAIARDNPDFAAYLRTQREWAILHANLLGDLRVDTEKLLADINAELGGAP